MQVVRTEPLNLAFSLHLQCKDGPKDSQQDCGGGGTESRSSSSSSWSCQGLPLKMRRLFAMFEHLSTDGGRSSVFQEMGAREAFDVFIVSTRQEEDDDDNMNNVNVG